jgi:hypothetical protein
MTNSRSFQWALAATVAAVLAACGGGGGSGNNNGGATPVADVTVEGVVAKGPATGATVSIFATDSSGKKANLLKQVTTSTGGAYSALITPQANAVLIEADLNGADIGDELNPGKTYKGNAGEIMLAAFHLQNGTKTVAHITPFSDMAAAMASSHGGTDTYALADVDAANKKVRDLTISDHLTASPTGEMLVKLTSVAQFVKNKHSGNLATALDELRNGSKFDSTKNGFVVSAAVSQGLATACNATAATCATDNNFASTVLAQTAVAPTGTTTTLDTVKALFKDLRDTAGAYSNVSKTGELDKAGDKLSLAVSSATGFVDDEALAIVAGITDGYKQYNDAKASPLTTPFYSLGYDFSVFGQVATKNTFGQLIPPSLQPRYACQLVKVTTLTTATGATDIATSVYAGPTTANGVSVAALPVADINAFACYGVGTVGRLFGTALDDGISRFNSVTVLPQPDGTFKYVHQTRKVNFDLTLQAASIRDGDAKFGTVAFVKDAQGRETTVNLTGELSPGFKMLRTRTVAERAKFKNHAVNLAFAATYPTSGTSTTPDSVAISGNMKLINADGTEASSLTIANGSQFSAKNDIVKTFSNSYFYVGGTFCPTGPGNTQFGTSPNLYCQVVSTYTSTVSELSAMNLTVAVAMPNAKFEGTFVAGSASFDASHNQYSPTAGSFDGKIYEGDGAGGYRLLLSGKVTAGADNHATYNASAPHTATNFLKGKASFEGKVMLAGRPDMGLTLNAQNDTFTQKSMSGTFFWNSRSFNISGVSDSATNTGSATISNSDGVSFTLPRNSGNVPRDIMKSGLKVGTINLATKRIDYTDGSFEQF